MRRAATSWLPVLAALLVVPAQAQDSVDCENAATQGEMNFCANKDYEEADAELNKAWMRARATAKEVDALYSDDLKGADKALLAAQRAWIVYRDATCELAGFEARGGTMEPMVVSSCLAEATRARTEELEEFIGGRGQ